MPRSRSNAGEHPSRERIRARLGEWYARVRRDLPWRRTGDPYAVWISETMLQQTRVETVIPYYGRFLEAIPSIAALAEAPEEHVLALWSGLGYYRRARMLKAAARQIVELHGGQLPDDVASLRRLSGIGPYTAGAVASIAFGRPAALVDGNVERVLARIYAVQENVRSREGKARIKSLAEMLIEGEARPGDWNQGLMELGATVCVPRSPRCSACPVADLCRARERGLTAKIPVVPPKRVPPTVQLEALVLASDEQVLLARRRTGLMFGGLWEPPRADGVDAMIRAMGARRPDIAFAGTVVHLLTHRRLEVRVWRGSLDRRKRFNLPGPEYDAVEVAEIERLGERPVATLARKILVVANVPPRGLP